MWGIREGCERAAAQINDVELDFLRRVDERQRHDEGTQRHRLTGERAADDREVTGSARQVKGQHIAALLEREVAGTHREDERAALTPLLRHIAEALNRRQIRHELIEGVGNIERGQPHLVGGYPLASHLGDRDV